MKRNDKTAIVVLLWLVGMVAGVYCLVDHCRYDNQVKKYNQRMHELKTEIENINAGRTDTAAKVWMIPDTNGMVQK